MIRALLEYILLLFDYSPFWAALSVVLTGFMLFGIVSILIDPYWPNNNPNLKKYKKY